ncbi:enamelin [Macrotis lagotis]|uniref:enamelin n=1 Tax=Macrotis lagotis TaxID=92651 RepID=UPI003D6863CE
MYEQDFEQPKEEDPPKVESTTAAPPANATASENNSTQPTVPSPGGSQGGNETGPTGNDAQAQNPGNNQGLYPGVHLSPTVNVSSYNVPGSQIPQIPNQPSIFENSPNPNFRSFPMVKQWSQTGFPSGPGINSPFYRNYLNQRTYPWYNLAYVSKQIVGPENIAYQKVYPYISKSNSPNHVSSPTNIYPTKHPEEANGESVDPKHGTAHRDEQNQNPKENPETQRDRTAFPTRLPIPTSTWGSSQGYETNKSNYKLPPLGPSVNSVDQHESSYYPRVDSRRFPAGIQTSNFPKGMASEPRKGSSDTEIKEMKHGTHHPEYTEESPYPPRESFFLGSNTWNFQQGSPNFEDEPVKQEGLLLYPTFGVRRNVPYPEFTPYDPQRNSPYARGGMWEDQDDFPGTLKPAGQPGNPSPSQNTPSGHRHPSTYNEEDPIDPTGDEFYQGSTAWGKESNFKESQVRYREKYLRGPSNPSEPNEFLQHSTNNLPRQRDFPYGKNYPWHPEGHVPSYNMAPLPRGNSGYYYPLHAFEREESRPSLSWGSWDQKNYVPKEKGRMPYYSGNPWNLYKSIANALNERENQYPSSNFPAGLKGNPGYQEAENLNYDSEQINRADLPEKGQFANPESVIQNNPINQGEAMSYPPASERNPCCAGDPEGLKDSPLVPLDYSPPFGIVSGEYEERKTVYSEGSHTKHARHIIYPPGIQPNQQNSSEKGENPDLPREDIGTLEKNVPCSKRSKVDLTGNVAFSETDSLHTNAPRCKSNFRGDGNKVLAKLFGINQFNERTSNLIPEELEAPEESSKPENIPSERGRSEGNMKQKGVPSIQKVPCLHSIQEKFLPPSTDPPLGKGISDPSEGEPTIVSAQPSSTLNGLAAREQLSGTNIDSPIASESPLSFPRNAEFQVPDCLLLQS